MIDIKTVLFLCLAVYMLTTVLTIANVYFVNLLLRRNSKDLNINKKSIMSKISFADDPLKQQGREEEEEEGHNFYS